MKNMLSVDSTVHTKKRSAAKAGRVIFMLSEIDVKHSLQKNNLPLFSGRDEEQRKSSRTTR